jgi:hypothetical protein
MDWNGLDVQFSHVFSVCIRFDQGYFPLSSHLQGDRSHSVVEVAGALRRPSLVKVFGSQYQWHSMAMGHIGTPKNNKKMTKPQ